jgi:hypothetical protein
MREVRFLARERMGVHADRQRGVGVPELRSDPAKTLPRFEGECREGVAGRMEAQRSSSLALGTPANALPRSFEVALVDGRAHLRAEHRLGHFGPAQAQGRPSPLREQIECPSSPYPVVR